MFETLSEFWQMDGTGLYVWGSYGVCFALMLGLAVQTLRRLRARQRDLDLLQGSRTRRGAPGDR
ncbi:MAG: heme exporter protein CcmD [Alphaproteobacteria bacterium]|nr:heme exporter protein CcmD [Alphaproteobacteria bacterium]